MRRKIYFILSIVMMMCLMAHAQRDKPAFYHWSFGVSSGDILHNVFNTENTEKAYAAFVLEYAGQQYALQAGFRPGYNMARTVHEGFSDHDIDKKISLSGDINLTRSLYHDERWDLRAGLTYQGGWSKEDIILDSGFDRVTTRRLEWNAGGGLVADLRFKIHPRISLGTQASLVYAYSQSELQQLFANFPDFDNTKDKVTDHEIHASEPMTIYLRFHF